MIREQISDNENWRFPSAAFSSFYQRKWRFPFKYLFLKNKNKYKLPIRFTKLLRKRNYLLKWGFFWNGAHDHHYNFLILGSKLHSICLSNAQIKKCCFNKHSLVHGTCDQTDTKYLTFYCKYFHNFILFHITNQDNVIFFSNLYQIFSNHIKLIYIWIYRTGARKYLPNLNWTCIFSNHTNIIVVFSLTSYQCSNCSIGGLLATMTFSYVRIFVMLAKFHVEIFIYNCVFPCIQFHFNCNYIKSLRFKIRRKRSSDIAWTLVVWDSMYYVKSWVRMPIEMKS